MGGVGITNHNSAPMVVSYITGIGLKINAQSKPFFPEDRLPMTTSSMRLFLWLWVSVFVQLNFVAHLAFNVISTFAHHLGLGQFPHCLQSDLWVPDSTSTHKLAVVLVRDNKATTDSLEPCCTSHSSPNAPPQGQWIVFADIHADTTMKQRPYIVHFELGARVAHAFQDLFDFCQET